MAEDLAKARARRLRWYYRNRDKVLRGRRERYLKDPTIREERLAASKRQRAMKIERPPNKKRPLKVDPNMAIPPRQYVIEVAGAKRVAWLFTRRSLCRAIQRRMATLENWENRGLIPMPLYRIRKPGAGWMYTSDQFQGIIGIFKEHEAEINAPGFRWGDSPVPHKLHQLWAALPDGFRRRA